MKFYFVEEDIEVFNEKGKRFHLIATAESAKGGEVYAILTRNITYHPKSCFIKKAKYDKEAILIEWKPFRNKELKESIITQFEKVQDYEYQEIEGMGFNAEIYSTYDPTSFVGFRWGKVQYTNAYSLPPPFLLDLHQRISCYSLSWEENE